MTAPRTWQCPQGHAFDVAREGYVNLLVTHQRRKREPGDAPAMIRARRRFLDGGWYAPLRDAVARVLSSRDARSVCDAGCGEGYYTRGWPDLWAIDLSKTAVRLAARRAGPGGHYAVASVYDMPIPSESMDAVVSVFAPRHATELGRVARPGGIVVTVTPGEHHLAGLVAELFAEVRPHPVGGRLDYGSVPAELRHGTTERLEYELTLDRASGAISDLLAMTPYSWYIDPVTRERMAALESLTTPVDFLITVYRR